MHLELFKSNARIKLEWYDQANAPVNIIYEQQVTSEKDTYACANVDDVVQQGPSQKEKGLIWHSSQISLSAVAGDALS